MSTYVVMQSPCTKITIGQNLSDEIDALETDFKGFPFCQRQGLISRPPLSLSKAFVWKGPSVPTAFERPNKVGTRTRPALSNAQYWLFDFAEILHVPRCRLNWLSCYAMSRFSSCQTFSSNYVIACQVNSPLNGDELRTNKKFTKGSENVLLVSLCSLWPSFIGSCCGLAWTLLILPI